MAGPPPRTPDERRAAAARAVRSRAVRAGVRRDLAAGRTDLATVLSAAAGDGDDAAALAAMRVRVLLESLPGVGERRAEAAMTGARIAPTRRVGGLGPGQRAALLRLFPPATDAPPGADAPGDGGAPAAP